MRKFLVVLDETRECVNAIRFAALRAARTGGGVQVLGVIAAEDIQHGFGVADVMRAEARERIEGQYEHYAKWMRAGPGIEPELIIREGDPTTELLAQLGDDPDIGVLVLGAANEKAGPGPITSKLIREIGMLPCPVTLVPGNLSRDRIEQIT